MSNSTDIPKRELPQLERAQKPSRKTQWLNLAALAVLVFVTIGRDTHDGGIDAAAIIETAAPFMIALVAGWVASKAWNTPTDIKTGLTVWPVTVILGMVLRRLFFDRGTAAAFIIVATTFLGVALVGWRAVHHLVAKKPKPVA